MKERDEILYHDLTPTDKVVVEGEVVSHTEDNLVLLGDTWPS